IKAPDCFYVERRLRERMKIPVFHDDQHGTAIVVGAALLNALKVSGKDIKQVKLVTSGAGAAALACVGLLVKLGVPRENIWPADLLWSRARGDQAALAPGTATTAGESAAAAVRATAALAPARQSDALTAASAGATLSCGHAYPLPRPFEPRLMMKIAPAVRRAA